MPWFRVQRPAPIMEHLIASNKRDLLELALSHDPAALTYVSRPPLIYALRCSNASTAVLKCIDDAASKLPEWDRRLHQARVK